MAVISRYNVTQDTINTAEIVEGFTVQTTFGRGLSITIKNTGENSLTWAVWGGNLSDLSDVVEVKANENVLDAMASSWSTDYAVFEFYVVYIASLVEDAPTTAVLSAIVKN